MLYIIATPIGNLEDLTHRAERILKEADYIFCEDTRITIRLLQRYAIKKPLVSYHAYSKPQRLDYLLRLLQEGKNVALVTDAGTPGISDPGAQVIRYLRENDPEILITAIPGPSAITAAAALSAFSTNKFLFLGFLPRKKGRQKLLQSLLDVPYTLVFYESPYRIQKTLAELRRVFGNRQAELYGELTKKFETVNCGTLEGVIAQLPGKPRGEFVLMMEGKRRAA